jgi:hypothetical protein
MLKGERTKKKDRSRSATRERGVLRLELEGRGGPQAHGGSSGRERKC